MKAIIFGATGMIGKGVLLECLDHPNVEAVLAIGRSKVDVTHPKLEQIEHCDLLDFTTIESNLTGYDACFYCLGVSAAGMSEAAYTKITYGFTLAAAQTLYKLNPEMTFTYVSGVGTDSSEKGRQMWARVKGKTENDIMSLGFKKAIMFRPGAIIPLRGIKSRTPLYQTIYTLFGWLLKILAQRNPDSFTDTTKIGLAMINAYTKGSDKTILSPKAINELATQ